MAQALELTPAIAQAILDALDDGSPPFIALAAERAGVPRQKVVNWMHHGDHYQCPIRTPFAREVRRIRAEWMAKTMAELLSATKDTSEATRQRAWLLERLDRELFSPPRFDKPAKEALPEPPKPVEPMTPQVEADLSTPEPVDAPASKRVH